MTSPLVTPSLSIPVYPVESCLTVKTQLINILLCKFSLPIQRHSYLPLEYRDASFVCSHRPCTHIRKPLSHIIIMVYAFLLYYTLSSLTRDMVSHLPLCSQNLTVTVPLDCSITFFLFWIYIWISHAYLVIFLDI